MVDDLQASFMSRHRGKILLFGLLIFLPPLSLILQATTGDSNFCGQWCPRMFFVWREGMGLSQYAFGWLRSLAGVLLVLGILLVTLFASRLWCSHLCPIGGAMELGSRVFPQTLKLNFDSIPAAPVRYGYMAVYMIAPAIGLGSLCCSYCNFATVPRIFGAAFGSPGDIAYFLRTAGLVNLGLVFLLGFLARGGRAYCNFLCPVGAIDALVNRFGMRFGKRYQIIEHRCNGCGECQEVCPTWAIELNDDRKQIDQLSCMPCGKCQTICPEQAVIYSKPCALVDGGKAGA